MTKQGPAPGAYLPPPGKPRWLIWPLDSGGTAIMWLKRIVKTWRQGGCCDGEGVFSGFPPDVGPVMLNRPDPPPDSTPLPHFKKSFISLDRQRLGNNGAV